MRAGPAPPAARVERERLVALALGMDDVAAAREAKAKVRMESTRRMFDSVDSDKSGSIDPIEFQRLRATGRR